MCQHPQFRPGSAIMGSLPSRKLMDKRENQATWNTAVRREMVKSFVDGSSNQAQIQSFGQSPEEESSKAVG